ncbi:MAG: phenylacetate-CoA oxygenase subunit PaaI [Gemmatimonadetes bacterium]|nr:phenylacetate-CoA oxygenase subunit PaaI [Gemmatimonadota bacterium]
MSTTLVETPADLTPEQRAAVHDLILVLADSKRLLGFRYASWILGAPELEAGIAFASMAQDEWGHARLLYALLKDFDDDVRHLEHGREPGEYRNLEVLDHEPDGWPGIIALNALADQALSAQLEAFRGSAYLPLRQRVEKLLAEERFHIAHGTAWFRRLARATPAARAEIAAAARAVLPTLLRWFGPQGGRDQALVQAGIADAAGDELRGRYLAAIAPLLQELGLAAADAPYPVVLDFDGFDEASRRVSTTGPDPETVARIRGDKNRPFLVD